MHEFGKFKNELESHVNRWQQDPVYQSECLHKQADEIILMDLLGSKYDALCEMGFEIVRRNKKAAD